MISQCPLRGGLPRRRRNLDGEYCGSALTLSTAVGRHHRSCRTATQDR